MLDKFLDCSLPPRVEQQVEDLEAHWYDAGSLGFDQQQHHQQATQGQRMLEAIEKEDTLEDLMYWTGQLAEAHPEFAEKVHTKKKATARFSFRFTGLGGMAVHVDDVTLGGVFYEGWGLEGRGAYALFPLSTWIILRSSPVFPPSHSQKHPISSSLPS